MPIGQQMLSTDDRHDELPSSASSLRIRRWVIVLLLIGAALWAAFAWGVMPSLIRKAVAGEHVPVLSESLGGTNEWPAEHYLNKWDKLAALALVGWLGTGVMTLIATSGWFARRFVGTATPGTLGAMRMFLCLLAAYWTFKTDLARVASLPHAQRIPMGLIDVLYALPLGFSIIDRSAMALNVLKGLAIAMLLLAAVGLKTRWTVIAGAVLYFVVAGVTRSYAKFFHEGLVPLYAVAVLCFTPCGDGWSVDRLVQQWRGWPVPSSDVPQPRYAWGRYALWTVIAVSYVCAGLSKLFNGSLLWWSSTNMQRLLYEEAFGFGANAHDDPTLKLTWVPTPVFALMGIGTLFLELGMGLTLLSIWARRLLPPMVAMMHVGIDLLQRIPFYDLVFVQVVFYDWGILRRRIGRALARRHGILVVRHDPLSLGHQRWMRLLPGLDLFGRLEYAPTPGGGWTVESNGRTLTGTDAARAVARVVPAGWTVLPLLYLPGVSDAIVRRLGNAGGRAGATLDRTDPTVSKPTRRVDHYQRPQWRLAPLGVVGLIVLSMGVWAMRVEAFPLTSWQMFSGYRDKGTVSYYKLYQTDETGRTTPLEQRHIAAMGPHKSVAFVLWRAFRDSAGERRCRELLAQTGQRINATAAPGRRVIRLKVVRREWDFIRDRYNSEYGRAMESLVVPLLPANAPATRAASF